MFDKVNEVITKKIRPQLMDHFGDIELLKVEDGVVEVKFLGSCGSCPSAKFTLEEVVEAELKKEIPQIKKVVLIETVSEELLDMARKILNKNK